ncbi:DNA polymerase epsilon subunit D [Colletotrichum higginsianum]|uniref:DNA polymerase epsilon subunit D n=1 Tax=Colletotrichum higginsianum (strain IMI 349063) TaxID=759273 RepID=H1VRK2_COLHI|nr:DNA polymerase epsilon subunit D [Colletotrichum higginsianum IMI 349063]OBR05036.1 DNA polymerase epsilon subunit D [Colletotrichum higginsianum IMI 349063]GJC99673.1 DNA polymerase epsilon subunit D [Colletotrichum higginsianum]CCF42858.1 DNA polymerase epsilon subunit D [Colletotrichum higginsianum]
MPPRKSDASRRSDVSNARFIVMDEDPAPAATPATAASTSSNGAAGTPSAAPRTKASVSVSASATPSSVPPAAAASTPDSATGVRPTSSTPLTTTTVLHAGSEKKESQTHDKMAKADRDALTIEDLSLPKSIITRLAKGVLPPNTQIQANAVLAMSKSATVFINYLASHANEITVNANKKTVSAEDVFKALDDIEFGFLREPLEQEFAKYNQIQSAKRTSYRQKVAAKKGGSAAAGVAVGAAAGAAAADASLLSNADDSAMTTASSDTAPRAKKARVDDSAMTVGEDVDDGETEPEEEAEEEEDNDNEEEEADEEEDDEEDDDEEGEGSGDETQDALEEKGEGSDVDEALDGDESD